MALENVPSFSLSVTERGQALVTEFLISAAPSLPPFLDMVTIACDLEEGQGHHCALKLNVTRALMKWDTVSRAILLCGFCKQLTPTKTRSFLTCAERQQQQEQEVNRHVD